MIGITIHIEGLDLAGKSTICRYFRDKYSFHLRNNSILDENPYIKEADYLRKNALKSDKDIGQLYYNALLYDLDNYRCDERRVIQDSTIIIRSIAFHSVIGNKNLAEKFKLLLPLHPRFCKSFVLTSSDNVRLQRLKGRCSRKNDSPEDYLIIKDSEAFHAMENIIIDLIVNDFHGEILDSSNMEKDGEKDRLANLILENII